jgi:hypothetical protein
MSSKNLKNEAALARVGLLHQTKKERKKKRRVFYFWNVTLSRSEHCDTAQ